MINLNSNVISFLRSSGEFLKSRISRNIVGFLLSLCLQASLALAGELAPPRHYQESMKNKTLDVYWTDAPPVLDGKADDTCWKTATMADQFVIVGSDGRIPSQATETRICYDAENLYVLWRLYEDRLERHNPGKPDDTQDVIDERDYVILQLDPDCTHKQWYALEANELGARRDSSIHGHPAPFSFDAKWRVKGGRFKDGWIMEMAVPFTEIIPPDGWRATPQKGDCWGMNFCRVREAGSEKSQWTDTIKLHFYGNYGKVFFRGRRKGAAPSGIVNDANKESFSFGPRVLSFSTAVPTENVCGTYRLVCGVETVAEGELVKREGKLTVPFRLTWGGEWRLSVNLFKDGELIYTFQEKATLPPLRKMVDEAWRKIEKARGMLSRFNHPKQKRLSKIIMRLRERVAASKSSLERADGLTRDEWNALRSRIDSWKSEWEKAAFDINLVGLYGPKHRNVPFAVGAGTSNDKYYPDTLYDGSLTKPIKISSAGNEYESFQLLVIPFWTDLKNVTVTMSDLRRREKTEDGTTPIISRKNCEWHPIDYVELPKKYFGTNGRFRQPEILLPARPMKVDKGIAAPIWIDLFLPAGTPSGIYTGEISVVSDKGTSTRSLQVECFGFSIPDEMHVRHNHWFLERRWAEYYGTVKNQAGRTRQRFIYNPKLYERHCRILSKYRSQCFRFGDQGLWKEMRIIAEKDGSFTFDFSALDKYVHIGKKYHANAYWANWGNHWGIYPWRWSNYPVIDRETNQKRAMKDYIGDWLEGWKKGDPYGKVYWDSNPVYRAFLEQYPKYLKKLGILDIAYFEINDEPYSSECRWLDFIRHQQWMGKQAPKLRKFSFGISPLQEVAGLRATGATDAWCPHLFECADPAVVERCHRRRQWYGEEFWWYVCTQRPDRNGNYSVGRWYTSPYISLRLMPWFAWHLRADGFFIYMLNTIPKENLELPPNKRWPASPWQAGPNNGGGTLVYPGPGPDFDIIPGMRLANLRDGMEDYEYFWMLRGLYETLTVEKHKALRKQIARELTIERPVIENIFIWTKELEPLRDKRRRMAELIVRGQHAQCDASNQQQTILTPEQTKKSGK